MLKYMDNESKKLFNTSGGDYKELGLKDKLSSMSIEEQLDLLSKNGNLVKRPFVLGDDFGFVGFKEEEWKKTNSIDYKSIEVPNVPFISGSENICEDDVYPPAPSDK